MSNEAIRIPDIGGAEAIEVVEIAVAVGDRVAVDDILIVLESDKASMEIPSPCAGTVASIDVNAGDTVSEGDTFAHIAMDSVETELESRPDVPAESVAESADTAEEASAAPVDISMSDLSTGKESETPPPAPQAAVHAGPAVRKLAREFGVDLGGVTGSGPFSRILKEDVQGYVKHRLQQPAAPSAAAFAPIPEVDFAQFGAIRIEPLSSVQKLTAANMHRSWLNIPRVSQFDEIDVTALEKFRRSMKAELESQGLRLTPLPFLLKACAGALRKNPMFNASLHADGEQLVYKEYVHIGMAVDTPAGLMVPVIRDVDRKSLLELAQESAELAALAKARKLKPGQMQGGCFTISSLGNIGGTGFTPIINAPELAILGVSRLSVKPVWNGKKFKPRKMLPLTLAYDHRAINGAVAGRFMQDLGAMLADVRRLLL